MILLEYVYYSYKYNIMRTIFRIHLILNKNKYIYFGLHSGLSDSKG